MPTSPTQRTLKLYRDAGYKAAVTEKWNAFAHIRQDLFGFGDVLAFGNAAFILVQTTTDSGRAARRDKILASPEAKAWVENGGVVHLVTWGRRAGVRGMVSHVTAFRLNYAAPTATPLITEAVIVYFDGVDDKTEKEYMTDE